MVWSSFKWSFESQMEIENLLIQIAEQSSSDHPGCKQGPGEGAADIGPHASSGQGGENTPVAISRPKGKKKIPQQCLSQLPRGLAGLPLDEEHPSVQQQPPSSGFAGNSVHRRTGQTPGGHLGFLAWNTDPGSWDQGTNIIYYYLLWSTPVVLVCMFTNWFMDNIM